MITARMWANMLGHSLYQITVVELLLFAGPQLFEIERGDLYQLRTKDGSLHYTIIFNSFVWMQLFNEVNARSLHGEFNVFGGILKNHLFCSILLATAALQVIMVQYGGEAMHVSEGGLSGELWGYSIAFGAGSLPIQQFINVLYAIQSSNGANDELKQGTLDNFILKSMSSDQRDA